MHHYTLNKLATMKIEIITTENHSVKESAYNLLGSMTKMGHTAKLSICHTQEELNDVVQRKPDLVVLAVKYITVNDKNNIWLSEFFAKNSINFSGSSKETLMFDSNRVLTKAYLKDKGISTSRYFTAIPDQYKRDFDIPINYPLFIKQIDAENTDGIDELSYINNFAEFQSKVASIYETYNLPVLVEEYIDGPEFTVALIKTIDGDLLVSTIEVVPAISEHALGIFGEHVKRESSQKIRKIEDSFLSDSVKALAIDTYIDLGIRDFGQINIKTNNSGNCFFMDVDFMPEMNDSSSYFFKACEMENNLSYDDVIKLIVDEGMSRVPLNNTIDANHLNASNK